MARQLKASRVSTLALSTMRDAFEGLANTITPADSEIVKSASNLDQVRAAAEEIETQLAARQTLRNMRRLTPLLNGLEHYAKAVEVLCNGTPYLAWIWSPITLVLRVASEYVEAFEAIMKGYSRIAESLKRFSILNETFSTNTGFQETLAVFYADILEFHKHAYKFVRRKGWRLLFHTSWGRFQRRFDNILEDLRCHGELIDLEANARDISEAHRMRQQLCTWREESLESVKRQEEQQTTKEYKELLSWLKVDETEQVSIFDGIAEVGTKYPGTCGWILQHPKINDWLKQKSDCRFIWLRGSPGSGKSVLSAQLVKFLSMNCTVVTHFCTYAYPNSTKYEWILRSILIQLVLGHDELVAHMYRECGLNKRSPSLSTLEQLVDVMLKGISENPRESRSIWIVVDGLDECEPEKQPRLLSLLNQMSARRGSEDGYVCKVLVSSRTSVVLKKRLKNGEVVPLSDEQQKPSLKAAIKQYTCRRMQLDVLGDKIRALDLEPTELQEIQSLISVKSDGMFLYARLVLDHLAANIFYSGAEIIECVRTLPKGLHEFYEKIMAQILARLDSRSVDRIRCILGWIAFSKRPLKRLEFLSALSFSSGSFDVDRLVPHYVLDACSPLIEERKDTSFAFIHVSVKDYLQSSGVSLLLKEQETLREHGQATFACLLSGLEAFSNTTTCNGQMRNLRLVKGLHGFHVYATEYWTDYLLNEAVSGFDTSSTFFRLANVLSEKLEKLTGIPIELETADTIDERLSSIKQYKVLYRQVRGALIARSLKQLQTQLMIETGPGNGQIPSCSSPPKGSITILLESYQNAVKHLVNQDSCPGASAEDLELFKRVFRTSAYTCRLHTCPSATTGFESEEARHDHEMGHAGGFRCSAPLCQYPPFRSAQLLKNHVAHCHNPTPPFRSLRRVGQLPTGGHDFVHWSRNPAGETRVRLRSGNDNHSGIATAPIEEPVDKLSQQVLSVGIPDRQDESRDGGPAALDFDTLISLGPSHFDFDALLNGADVNSQPSGSGTQTGLLNDSSPYAGLPPKRPRRAVVMPGQSVQPPSKPAPDVLEAPIPQMGTGGSNVSQNYLAPVDPTYTPTLSVHNTLPESIKCICSNFLPASTSQCRRCATCGGIHHIRCYRQLPKYVEGFEQFCASCFHQSLPPAVTSIQEVYPNRVSTNDPSGNDGTAPAREMNEQHVPVHGQAIWSCHAPTLVDPSRFYHELCFPAALISEDPLCYLCGTKREYLPTKSQLISHVSGHRLGLCDSTAMYHDFKEFCKHFREFHGASYVSWDKGKFEGFFRRGVHLNAKPGRNGRNALSTDSGTVDPAGPRINNSVSTSNTSATALNPDVRVKITNQSKDERKRKRTGDNSGNSVMAKWPSPCIECGKMFNSMRERDLHVSNSHFELAAWPRYKCLRCGFSIREALSTTCWSLLSYHIFSCQNGLKLFREKMMASYGDDYTQFDLDRQCGVMDRHGVPCNKPLSCSKHTGESKKSVPGRNQPFADLLERELSGEYRLLSTEY